ncbi:hypothetical protein B0A52_03177 [Exophiala mesophila]|uniref:Major facilitator superfamily (MFS) profile domain-containing protein n=1 Tax=Exophiala mesophila TaxID=212818 RepID=A0A438NAM1_EXOME|nr:hypothetical protein B0A52_03177 [Exophiala mesophila]
MTYPVPGTVHLVDLAGNLSAKHEAGGNNQIVLIPQPSSDPDDPLNWTWWRKNHNRFWQIMWTVVGCAIISSLSPAYLLIQEDTGIPIADLNTGIGLMYLFLGWGNVVTQPLAMNFGRRPVLILSLLGTSLMILWSAYIKSSGVWFVNRILMGIFYAPVESLVEILVTDLSFTHERGFHMGVYSWTLWNGAFLSPIAAGYIAQNHGWRWIQYTGTIIGLSVTVLMFFFFEETMYFRQTIQAEFLDEFDSNSNHASSTEEGVEKNEKSQSGDPGSKTPKAALEEVALGKSNKTYLSKLRMWGLRSPDQPNTFWKFFLLPFTLVRFPAMLFAGLLVGSILAWFNVLNATIAEVFGNAPYNFDTNEIGLIYLAAVIGTTVGCFLSGWFSDIISEKLARRNKGIKEPEARLWIALVTLFLHPFGCFLYGIGAAQKIHWIGLAFGIGFISLSLPTGSNIGLTYVIDSYKEVAGESMTTVILIRNTIGFAFAYAIAPMISSLGLQNSFILVGCLGAGFWCLCFLMMWKGKEWRQKTGPAYWKLVEEHGLHAH